MFYLFSQHHFLVANARELFCTCLQHYYIIVGYFHVTMHMHTLQPLNELLSPSLLLRLRFYIERHLSSDHLLPLFTLTRTHQREKD